jgi:hypothetical protein
MRPPYRPHMSHSIPGLRSPFDEVGGIVYFGRMIDKIRLHQAGKLPAEYVPNLGKGFDARCVHFLHISYQALVDRVAEISASDEELLEWACKNGERPDDEDIEVWNGFMTKRGWNDSGAETLLKRKAESGFPGREDIRTIFQYIDADEGRLS